MTTSMPCRPDVAGKRGEVVTPKGEAVAADPMEERPSGTSPQKVTPQPAGEINGPKGPEPTRYGDWEKGGRCSDF